MTIYRTNLDNSPALEPRDEKLDEAKNLSVLWHYPSASWLMADGKSTTEDVDLAGRFTTEQVAQLQAQYPGERFPQVTPHLEGEVYAMVNSPGIRGKLMIRQAEFVLWGYGERVLGAENVAQARAPITDTFSLKFKLPEAEKGRQAPQEYERRRSWAWQFVFRGGDGWKLADSQEAALAAAKEEALQEMRSTGHRHCLAWLTAKHCVEVSREAE